MYLRLVVFLPEPAIYLNDLFIKQGKELKSRSRNIYFSISHIRTSVYSIISFDIFVKRNNRLLKFFSVNSNENFLR